MCSKEEEDVDVEAFDIICCWSCALFFCVFVGVCIDGVYERMVL